MRYIHLLFAYLLTTSKLWTQSSSYGLYPVSVQMTTKQLQHFRFITVPAAMCARTHLGRNRAVSNNFILRVQYGGDEQTSGLRPQAGIGSFFNFLLWNDAFWRKSNAVHHHWFSGGGGDDEMTGLRLIKCFVIISGAGVWTRKTTPNYITALGRNRIEGAWMGVARAHACPRHFLNSGWIETGLINCQEWGRRTSAEWKQPPYLSRNSAWWQVEKPCN